MGSPPRYLLIIGCSQRKRPDPGLLPALERYDGVNFRVLRKARREGYWPENLDVLIVSAKYGLLKSDTFIENYDQRMTLYQALTLQPIVSASLNAHLTQVNYYEVFINLGQTYLLTLTGSRKIAELRDRVFYASGGIGKKMAQMKQWLYCIAQSQGNYRCQGEQQ